MNYIVKHTRGFETTRDFITSHISKRKIFTLSTYVKYRPCLIAALIHPALGAEEAGNSANIFREKNCVGMTLSCSQSHRLLSISLPPVPWLAQNINLSFQQQRRGDTRLKTARCLHCAWLYKYSISFSLSRVSLLHKIRLRNGWRMRQTQKRSEKGFSVAAQASQEQPSGLTGREGGRSVLWIPCLSITSGREAMRGLCIFVCLFYSQLFTYVFTAF